MEPLFETIIKVVPAPAGYLDMPFQMLVTTIDYNEYVGKIGIGKIERGSIKKNQAVALIRKDGKVDNVKVSNLYVYNGLKKEETIEAQL